MQDTGWRTHPKRPRVTLARPDTLALDAPCALLLGGDRPTRLMLRHLLNSDGCAVIEATSAQTLGTAPPPPHIALLMVIADESVQHLVAALTGLRRRGYGAPAVVLTHAPTQELRRRAFALDVRDVIMLPARAHELSARLRVALGNDACARGRRDATRGHSGRPSPAGQRRA